ncbi:hypothetical protein [Streptomyces sp. NRRL F-5755]|uniref:hypothetical protein n=1 Tax=Streptomyces sp. NRRL F-5755 TaxID=1519475 RepID=UPI000A7FCFF3|nr:hypothetical protein [Streptomyces sp. NRRL F-5755]
MQSSRRGKRLGTLGWLSVTLGGVCPGFQVLAPDRVMWVQWLAGLALVVAGVWAVLRGRQHTVRVLASMEDIPRG